MKRLHDLRAPAPTHAYFWYTAIQTRRGMRHLVRVPILPLDIDRMVMPANARYNHEAGTRWRTGVAQGGRDIALPFDVRPEIAHRLCGRQQAAVMYRWEYSQYHTGANPPRSFCQTCWRALPQHAGTIVEFARSQTIGTLRDPQSAWEEYVSLRVYGRQ